VVKAMNMEHPLVACMPASCATSKSTSMTRSGWASGAREPSQRHAKNAGGRGGGRVRVAPNHPVSRQLRQRANSFSGVAVIPL
jgi:hypothetical protein